MKMSKFDQWLNTLTIKEKRNLVCNHYENCEDCPLRHFNDCAVQESKEIIDYFKDSEQIDESNVMKEIIALRLTMALLKIVEYGDDEKACALHDMIISTLDDIEDAYRKEKRK